VTDASQLKDLAGSIGCEVSEDRAALLLAYLDAMLEENKGVNLTAVRDREAAVMFHALDALALGSRELGLQPTDCLDLGTGNGFPGVAIACLFPEARVLLMDRTLKKLRAIERALGAAGFEPGQVSTVQMDAAEAPAHGDRQRFDLVTVRAVGPPEVVAQLARPLVKRGGDLLLWLSGESELAPAVGGDLDLRASVDYALPEPAGRVRRLAAYRR
jgi:16S rRNA (guanine527-N7)-methyltransferase